MLRAAALVAVAVAAGCSQEPATSGNLAVAAVQDRAASATPAAMPSPTAAATVSPGDPAAVARAFVTLASAGDAEALRYWDGQDADARAARDRLASHRGDPIEIGAPADGDAGMGQRYVTVPFTIGGAKGSALLHRVAEGFESDDPRAHDWRVRTVSFGEAKDAPAAAPTGDASLPATAEATYDCTPGGPTLMVRFDNRADTAVTTIGGRTVTLAGQRPASGIWYAGDGYELRGKGRQARFAMPDGTARECLAR